MAGHSDSGTDPGTPAERIVLAVAAQHAALLARLRQELGPDAGPALAAAAERLALEFGPVTAAAVEAALGAGVPAAGAAKAGAPIWEAGTAGRPAAAAAAAERGEEATSDRPAAGGGEKPVSDRPAAGHERELRSLFQQGQMRRRLEQLIETNRRYGHPFGLAVFDAAGPDARGEGEEPETVLAVVGAALRDSIRLVDEAFRLEEDALCVLAPNIATIEGVQMAERLLGRLEQLEQAGGMRISLAAGVVACPDHGDEADALLHKADAALWRARAVGQPVGVGALDAVQDR
ncbi:MAG: diguanylate cyclase [Solirubrobacterales bacterium]